MEHHVLIIEDEQSLLNILSRSFEKDNFKTTIAHDGEEGLRLFSPEIHCVIVDITMPKLDGWEVVSRIREQSDIPIVIMTALTSEDNALKGYSLKIDDYITKPFSPILLVAKVKNLIARYQGKFNINQHILRIGHLSIDESSREVTIKGNLINLSKTEYDLLVYLIVNKNIVLSRTQILDSVWGNESTVEERVVDAFIKSIRKKIGAPYAEAIKTVFGVGYRFVWE